MYWLLGCYKPSDEINLLIHFMFSCLSWNAYVGLGNVVKRRLKRGITQDLMIVNFPCSVSDLWIFHDVVPCVLKFICSSLKIVENNMTNIFQWFFEPRKKYVGTELLTGMLFVTYPCSHSCITINFQHRDNCKLLSVWISLKRT